MAEKNGNNVEIGIQDKDILTCLLENEGLKYKILSAHPQKRTRIQLLKQWSKHKNSFMKLTENLKPDFLIGTSVAINWVGRKYNAISLNFNEDDAKVIRDYWFLATHFVTGKIKPSCLSPENRTRITLILIPKGSLRDG